MDGKLKYYSRWLEFMVKKKSNCFLNALKDCNIFWNDLIPILQIDISQQHRNADKWNRLKSEAFGIRTIEQDAAGNIKKSF